MSDLMLFKYLLLFIIILDGSSCLPEAKWYLVGKREMQTNIKHAYINHTGEIAIDASKYQSVGNFSEGLAAVESKEGYKGFINKSGDMVIKTQFREVGKFSDGLATVKIHEKMSILQPDDKWGYIDKTGRIVIETDYDQLYDFSEGIAVARKGNELFLIDKTGRAILSLNMDEIQLEYSGNQKFSEGLIVACDAKTKKCGFMDKTGKFIIEPKFNDASSFSEGLAKVSIIKNHKEMLGFINRNGDYVIPPKFDIDDDFLRNTTDFSEGLASLMDGPPTMTKDSNFMYIDKTGEIVLRTDFFRADSFNEGLAVVYDADNNKYGFIDKSGKIVIPVQYDYAYEFSEGLAHVAVSN